MRSAGGVQIGARAVQMTHVQSLILYRLLVMSVTSFTSCMQSLYVLLQNAAKGSKFESAFVYGINPLAFRGNYSATSNNMKLVHWPLMDGLLHLV